MKKFLLLVFLLSACGATVDPPPTPAPHREYRPDGLACGTSIECASSCCALGACTTLGAAARFDRPEDCSCTADSDDCAAFGRAVCRGGRCEMIADPD